MHCYYSHALKGNNHNLRPTKKCVGLPFHPIFCLGQSVGSILFIIFVLFRCQRTPKTALTFHERSSCQASKVLIILYILLQSLFLRLYFGKFLQKQFTRVISITRFFVRSINERYMYGHYWQQCPLLFNGVLDWFLVKA